MFIFAGSFFEGGMGRDGEIGRFQWKPMDLQLCQLFITAVVHIHWTCGWFWHYEAPDAATGIFPLFERFLREELEGKEGATGGELGWWKVGWSEAPQLSFTDVASWHRPLRVSLLWLSTEVVNQSGDVNIQLTYDWYTYKMWKLGFWTQTSSTTPSYPFPESLNSAQPLTCTGSALDTSQLSLGEICQVRFWNLGLSLWTTGPKSVETM